MDRRHLQVAHLHSYGDHRLGMMAAIAALVASGPIQIEDPSCIDISYPDFSKTWKSLLSRQTLKG